MSLSTVEVSVVTNNKESDISVNSVAGATMGEVGKDEIVPISELSTQHIVNIINKIKRDKWRVDYLGIMERELRKRI